MKYWIFDNDFKNFNTELELKTYMGENKVNEILTIKTKNDYVVIKTEDTFKYFTNTKTGIKDLQQFLNQVYDGFSDKYKEALAIAIDVENKNGWINIVKGIVDLPFKEIIDDVLQVIVDATCKYGGKDFKYTYFKND